jgi:hypothetical protein
MSIRSCPSLASLLIITLALSSTPPAFAQEAQVRQVLIQNSWCGDRRLATGIESRRVEFGPNGLVTMSIHTELMGDLVSNNRMQARWSLKGEALSFHEDGIPTVTYPIRLHMLQGQLMLTMPNITYQAC